MSAKHRAAQPGNAERTALGTVPAGLVQTSGSPVALELVGPSEQDIAFYLAMLPGWREHEGEHVLIYEGAAHGFFATRTEALSEGYRRFGRVPFLVKRVEIDEQPRPLVGGVL